MTLKTTITLPLLAAAALSLHSCADLPSAALFPGHSAQVQTPAPQNPAPTSAPTQQATSSQYPIAYPLVGKDGKVVKDVYISPFPPHNPINTKGFSSGQLAGDPSTMEKDPKTGKPIKSTVKIFRLQ